ncbi:MAG: DUF3180 domain-containing protein [Candidatus Nanopelagicales bacterium]
MQPTSIRLLLAIAVSGMFLGFVGARIWDDWTGAPPSVPWAAPLLLAAIAGAFAVAAITLRPRIERRPGHRPLDPFTAARTAVLALAGSRTGSGVAGVYLGYAAFLLLDLNNSYRRRLLLVICVAALMGVAMAAGALWLERICRVDSSDDDPGSVTSTA